MNAYNQFISFHKPAGCQKGRQDTIHVNYDRTATQLNQEVVVVLPLILDSDTLPSMTVHVCCHKSS